MKKHGLYLFVAAASVGAALADTYTWTGAESAVWDTTTANWTNADGDACTWVNGVDSYAVFDYTSSQVTNVVVSENVVMTNLAVNAGNFAFTGDGMLDVACLDAQDGASITLGGYFTNSTHSTTLAKRYTGSLVIAGTGVVHRLAILNGTLALKAGSYLTLGNVLVGAADQRPTYFHSDGGWIDFEAWQETLVVFNNFTRATLGEGGLTMSGPGAHTYTVYQSIETADGVEHDGGVVKYGGCVLTFSGSSTFNGGVTVYQGQLRAEKDDSLGTGDVVLNDGTSFFVNNAATISNVIRHGWNTFIGSVGNFALTVKALDIMGTNARGYIGRVNGGVGAVTLSLDPERSSPLGGITIRGTLDLRFDGCELTGRHGGDIPYFNIDDLYVEPVASVSRNGLTFDTDVMWTDLGLTLKFDGNLTQTNVVQSIDFSNCSFETGAWSPWSAGQLTGAPNGAPPVPQENGSAFLNDSAYYTTNGKYCAVLRRLNYMEQTVNVPTAGLWRVVFDGGCRPDYTSYLVPLTVWVDDVADEIPARSSIYTFRRFEMPPHELTAGGHVVRFETGTTSKAYDCHFFDTIRLERVEVVETTSGPFVKKGVGSLTVTNLVKEGHVAASNGVLNVWGGCVTNGTLAAADGGTLSLFDVSLDGVAAEVASGGTLELHGGTVTNAEVNVASGGTLAFSSVGPNLVKNCSFETSNPVDNKFATWTPAGWSYVRGTQPAYSGLQSNGGTVSANWYATPYGDTTAYVRSCTTLSQTLDVPADGEYVLNFVHCARNYSNSYNIPLTVLLDDVPVLEIPARTAYYDYTRETTTNLTMAAGSHTIAFDVQGTLASGAMLFIDDVHLETAAPALVPGGTVFNLASGSTVALDNDDTIVLDSRTVYVDGSEIRGSETALTRAGVTVTGTGHLQIGPPIGTTVIVR